MQANRTRGVSSSVAPASSAVRASAASLSLDGRRARLRRARRRSRAAGGRGGPPRSPREAAPVDLTGYWVSVVTEDWRWRMVTPASGDFAGVPLNAAARKLGLAWDPAKDEAAGEQCRAYGAAGDHARARAAAHHLAGRQTLKIETDAGTQTRLLPLRRHAAGAARSADRGRATRRRSGSRRCAARAPPDFLPIALNPREGTRGRSLEVVTTHLRPGYLRKNGVPYSARTTLREYFDVSPSATATPGSSVTTIVEDPEYLTTPFVTSTDFKKQPDATGWNPTPCSAR